MITAGGTREAIDDVRFIGNRSSGKQGVAIAQAAKARGADVTLIAANIDTSKLFNINVISVVNTQQLQHELGREFKNCDILIMAAAVSDARPIATEGKVKKDQYKQLDLEQTPDLLAEIARTRNEQFIVGFAAEEGANLLQEGRRKLAAKDLNLIYANNIEDGKIFGSDQTSGYLISSDSTIEITKMSKETLAAKLLDAVVERLNSPNV